MILRAALGLALTLLALSGAAWAQESLSAQDIGLPKKPIPYRLLERRTHRLAVKKTLKPASPASTPPPPSVAATSPAAHAAPVAPSRASSALGRPPDAGAPRAAANPPHAPPPPPPALAPRSSPEPVPQPLARTAGPVAATAPAPVPATVPAKLPAMLPVGVHAGGGPAPPQPSAAPAPPIAAPPSAIALSPTSVGDFVDGLVASAWSEEHLAGVVVAIVQDGRPLLIKGYGRAAPGRPMDPVKTRVRLGRTSEIFTWMLLTQAVSSGRVHVEDPVNAHLPPDLQIPEEGFAAPVTIADLLAHTGGFEDRLLGRRYLLDPARLTPFETALTRLRPRRVRPPRRLAIPSAYGVALAAEVAARMHGQSFQSLVEARLLQPLALRKTSFREPYPARDGLAPPLSEEERADLADSYLWTPHGLEAGPYAFGQSLAPAVAGTTSANDMARLMTAVVDHGVLDGRQVLDRRAVDLITTPLWSGFGGVQRASYGLAETALDSGVEIFQTQDQGPGFTASLALAPKLRLGVFFASDSDGGGRLGRRLLPALLSRYTPPGPQAPTQTSEVDASGAFLPAQRAYHGLEALVDRLILPIRSTTRRDGAGLILDERGLDERGAQRPYRRLADTRFKADDGQELLLVDDGSGPFALVLGGGGGAAERLDRLRSLSTLAAAAAAAGLVILFSLSGLVARARVEPRETPQQALAGGLQIVACVLWTGALTAFGAFVSRGLSRSRLMYEWPDDTLVLASWLAVAASVLTAALLFQLPNVWRDGRRIAGWTTSRKLRHTGGLLLFLVFALVLAAWGALEPWSS